MKNDEKLAVEPSQPAPDPYNACESFKMYGLVCRQNASLLKQIEALEDRLASTPPAPAAPSPDAARERLEKFLNAAAGDGFVCGDVDAADLYVELFPAEYAAALAASTKGDAS